MILNRYVPPSSTAPDRQFKESLLARPMPITQSLLHITSCLLRIRVTHGRITHFDNFVRRRDCRRATMPQVHLVFTEFTEVCTEVDRSFLNGYLNYANLTVFGT